MPPAKNSNYHPCITLNKNPGPIFLPTGYQSSYLKIKKSARERGGQNIHTISFSADIEVAPPATPRLPHRFSLQCSEGVNEGGFLRYLNNIPDCRGCAAHSPPGSPGPRGGFHCLGARGGMGPRPLVPVPTTPRFLKTKALYGSVALPSCENDQTGGT